MVLTTRSSYLTVWGFTVVGLVAAATWIASDTNGSAGDTLRLVGGAFLAMTVGALVLRIAALGCDGAPADRAT